MFGFLNTTVLFAAAAALIPLIIHLFSRRRVKVVEFSSVRHLKQMQRRQLRRLRVRQWLLLLLRMLIILLVVLAFARPTLREGSVGSHASVSAVVLLDNSASMKQMVADGELFELARRRTGELLESLSQSDQVCLLPLAPSSGGVLEQFVSSAAAAEELARLEPVAGRADFQTGLAKALELLGGAASLNRELYIVTDRQRTSLPEERPAGLDEVKLYFVNVPLEEDDNVGLVSLDLGGQLIQPGRDFPVVATVANYGREPSGERIASLFLNGQRVAQTDFSVPAGGEATVRFSRSVSRTGFHSGYVELSDDKFAEDNRYYFSFRIPDQFNVLIVSDDPAAQFVALALNPPSSSGQYWSVKTAAPDALAGVQFGDYDVIMLIGAPDIGANYSARLAAAVARGRSLLVTYGGDTDINRFNRTWMDLTGVRYTEPVKRNFTRAGYYSFASVDMDHPIFSVFELENDRPPEVKFYTIPKLTVANDARTLMRFTGGQAALAERQSGRGKVLTFTGPMSPEYGDLVTKGFFVSLISRIAEYLASDLTSFDLDLRTGRPMARSLSVQGAPIYAVELLAPDSSAVTLEPEDEAGALVMHTGPLAAAGVYSVISRGREIDRFAVNLEPAEGDLTAAEPDQFAASLGQGDYRAIDYRVDPGEAIAGFRVGRELWQLFLWAAVILLAVEMLLGRRLPSED